MLYYTTRVSFGGPPLEFVCQYAHHDNPVCMYMYMYVAPPTVFQIQVSLIPLNKFSKWKPNNSPDLSPVHSIYQGRMSLLINHTVMKTWILHEHVIKYLKIVTDGQTDSLIKCMVVYRSYSYGFWSTLLWAPGIIFIYIIGIIQTLSGFFTKEI